MIPIVIGVTGHRDLRDKDVKRIKSSVRQKFQEILNQFPNSEFLLISGLAEGADMLVAEIGLSFSRVSLIAALPFEIDEYINDFEFAESKLKFKNLLESAIKTVVTSKGRDLTDRNQGYVAVADYIAKNSQILLALWDGIYEQSNTTDKMNISPGGTADVVRKTVSGVKSLNPLALPDPVRLEHLFVFRQRSDRGFVQNNKRRQSNWEIIDNKKTIGRTLQQIEALNANAMGLQKTDLTKSAEYLFEGNQRDVINRKFNKLITAYSVADTLAGIKQKKRFSGILLVSFFALTAVISQQIFGAFGSRSIWIVSYLIFATVSASIYYYYFKKSKNDEDFLDWRSLAEGIRVQIFWKSTGIDQSIADHYFSEDSDELAWLRSAVRNLDLVADSDKSNSNFDWVRDVWLNGQAEYFKGKSTWNSGRDRLFSSLAQSSILFAAVCLLIILIFQFLIPDPIIVNIAAFGSGIFLILAASFKAFSEQMGYAIQSNRYSVMARIYQTAVKQFDESLLRNDWHYCRVILTEVGKEALAENTTWLRVHRERKFELSIG